MLVDDIVVVIQCICESAGDLTDLYPAHLPSGLHPAGHIDGVAPDVVLRLAAPHHARHHRASGQADSEGEHLSSTVGQSGA